MLKWADRIGPSWTGAARLFWLTVLCLFAAGCAPLGETVGSGLQPRQSEYAYPPPYNYPLSVQAYQDEQVQNALINQALVKYSFSR